jgi:hypothetical protein
MSKILGEGRAIATEILSTKNNIDSLSICVVNWGKMTGDLALSLSCPLCGKSLSRGRGTCTPFSCGRRE